MPGFENRALKKKKRAERRRNDDKISKFRILSGIINIGRRIYKYVIYAYLVRRKVLPDSRIFSSLSNNVRTTLVRVHSTQNINNII